MFKVTAIQIAAIAASVLAVLFAIFVGRLLWPAARRQDSRNTEWCRSFTATRYRPMERLLSADDESFLRSQPASTHRFLRRFRAERRKIFRQYLTNIRRDFQSLYLELNDLLLASEVDRPDLAAELVRVKATFYFALAAVEYRLLLHAIGIGTVNAQPLVESMRFFETQFAELAA